jgi:hypothetical protein
VTQRRERLALVHERVDDVGSEEAGKDAHAVVTQRSAAVGDHLPAERALEVVDRVAVEVDEVGRRGDAEGYDVAIADDTVTSST